MAKYWKRRANINLIPLIDVLVNLIFFFVVFGTLGEGTAALPIRPPASRTAPPIEAARMVVALDAGGLYTIDGRPVSPAEVSLRVEEALAGHPGLQVVLFPDRTIAYETLVEALDLLRAGGAERPALGVQRETR